MRLDKFLKVSRILKRRTVANATCDSGRVEVNGKPQKPSYRLKVGDIVAILYNGATLKFRVLSIAPAVKKDEALSMYEIID